MSVINELFEQLEKANHPIARSIHKGDQCKVLAIGFKARMILKDHKTHLPSKLTVIHGAVFYREGERVIQLKQYDEITVPTEIVHSVEAIDDSLCLLIQG
jgi:quercetin dioxygenase-like cupin family protein